MIVQKLHDHWQMRNLQDSKFFPAVVPGSVYNDLLLNGQMEDPFWKDNELQALKVMDSDFEYVSDFDAEPGLLKSDKVLLHFDGLDTIADIWLNKVLLGRAENMHRVWEYDVTGLVREKDNQLKVLFHSPTKYIKEQYALCKADGSSDAMVGFAHIRKAHCMFGWDWGPRLPDAGIWRGVSLLGITAARIDSVHITQAHHENSVDLKLEVSADQVRESGLSYQAEVTSPDGKTAVYPGSPTEISIDRPQLWWPNGYGEHPLYTVKVTLFADKNKVDSWERRIGLRTMTMHIEKDEEGESFAHEVNGVQIFAMGADYIPEDNILARVNPERTRKLLKDCADANFNCIRVWGGGYYPDDFFYDICDELGLVVWQDMMYACAVYELTSEFEQNIRKETADNVKRLRHHASLGLWCGNNEMEMFVDQGQWVNTPKQKADYIRIFEYIIPSVIKEYDPVTFYWPASPSSGGGFDKPNDPSRGDVHYWEVWHGNKPFTDYRNYRFRYLSEFGFQSFPLMKTVETFTEPEDRNIFSYVMEKHQRNNAANGKIMNYMAQTFLYPTSFETLLYASQLLQAEAIKYGVEHFRRNRGVCMGSIYWQLNDCWPVASWASIDYCGRWKALHYYAKRFFAPLLLSCCEEGILTQDTNVNAEPYTLEKSFRLSVANETMSDKTVTVKWALRNNKAEVLREGENKVSVPSLTSVWLDKVDLPEAEQYSDYVSYDLYENGEKISGSTVIFSVPKHFHYLNPNLTCRVEGDEIVVHADAYAKSVEILNENEDLILSDNYFDMNAGETRVKILEGEPTDLRLRSVYDIR